MSMLFQEAVKYRGDLILQQTWMGQSLLNCFTSSLFRLYAHPVTSILQSSVNSLQNPY